MEVENKKEYEAINRIGKAIFGQKQVVLNMSKMLTYISKNNYAVESLDLLVQAMSGVKISDLRADLCSKEQQKRYNEAHYCVYIVGSGTGLLVEELAGWVFNRSLWAKVLERLPKM